MNAYQGSVAHYPLWILQAVLVVAFLLIAALYLHIKRKEPVIQVAGVKAEGMIEVYAPSDDYAIAVGKRFVQEFYNWGYTNHYLAKRRASALCRPDVAQKMLQLAREEDPYFNRLLVSSSVGQIESAEVAWVNQAKTFYAVKIVLTVQEWAAHVATERTMEAMLHLAANIEDRYDTSIQLAITRWSLTQKGDIRTRDVPMSISDQQIEDIRRAKEDEIDAALPRPVRSDASVPNAKSSASAGARRSKSETDTSPSGPSLAPTPSVPASSSPPSSGSGQNQTSPIEKKD